MSLPTHAEALRRLVDVARLIDADECPELYNQLQGELAVAGAVLAGPQAEASQEHVAEIASTFLLVWAGSGPIAPIVEKHGLRVGSKLYAAPQADVVRDAAETKLLLAAKAFAKEHIDGDALHEDSSVPDEIVEASDERYNETKRQLCDAYIELTIAAMAAEEMVDIARAALAAAGAEVT